MEVTNIQKPCLVQTEQGFSVSYKNKLLYSKYNPSRAILQTISTLNILPGTVILCCSPVLNYGLLELSNKLPENCILFGCEFDSELHDFINDHKQDYQNICNFQNLTFEELYNLGPILNQKEYTFSDGKTLQLAGRFKRVFKLDFSAGVQLNAATYQDLYLSCVNSIKVFWSNRVTLTAFGRKYSQDIFKNLKNLEHSTPISNYFNNVNKPIILFGAGESTDSGINKIKSNSKDYFILCADTALNSLIQNNIYPDGVFIEEAQFVISKAFIGLLKHNTQIFSGLSSRDFIPSSYERKNISYFLTRFSSNTFLNNLENKSFIISTNPPFGSVGLTMVYYALKFRKNDSVPIYIYGLDFSYSAGRTHAKGTMAHLTALINTSRLVPVHNYKACFNNSTKVFHDKNQNIFFTTQVLSNYAQMFTGLFSKEKNLFDSSDCGIPLNLNHKEPEIIAGTENTILQSGFSEEQKKDLQEYLLNEKTALIELRNILTGATALSSTERDKKITELLEPRDYLYLHFPDSHKFCLNQSFLNRIRTEIDFFLKLI